MVFYLQKTSFTAVLEGRHHCASCETLNDHDYLFCKSCRVARKGTSKESDSNLLSQETLDRINSRIAYLDSIINSATYSKQKFNLAHEMTEFLARVGKANSTKGNIKCFTRVI